MHPKTLRFYAEGTGLTPDFLAQEAGLRRFIGRKFETLTVDGEERTGFVPTNEAEEVPCSKDFALAPHVHDYVRAAKEGHLLPADEATAKFCGLEFRAYVKEPDPLGARLSDHPEIGDAKPGLVSVPKAGRLPSDLAAKEAV